MDTHTYIFNLAFFPKKISDALSIFTEAFLLHSSLVDQLADLIGAVRADKMRRKTEL